MPAQSLNLNTLDFQDLYSTLLDYIQHPPKSGCLGLMGGPGTGKTDGVECASAQLDVPLSYVNAPLISPGDLLGAAFPSPDRAWTEFLPTRLLGEDAVMFVDELPNSDRSVQNVMNRILLTGELNGRRFPQARIWAGNPTTTSSMAEVLPEILVNKSTIFVVNYTHKDFVSFFSTIGHEKIHPLVASFIGETRDRYLQVKAYTPHQHDGVAVPVPGDPFPSPRSYERLSDELRKVEAGRVPYDVFKAAYATVGVEAGKAFGDYITVSKYIPSVTKILSGNNPKFKDEAFVEGKLMTTLQVMVLYMIIGATQDEAELAQGCRWVFNGVKTELFGPEVLRTFTELLLQSRFSGKFSTVCSGVGEDVFGKKAYRAFIDSVIRRDVAAGQF